MSPHIHPLKTKVKKPKTKGTKADSVEKVTVADLLPTVLENIDFKLDEQPYSSLFAIYQKEFLDISVSTGLICELCKKVTLNQLHRINTRFSWIVLV